MQKPLPSPKETLITTNEMARRVGVEGATIRRAYCVRGHYMNMRPVKLPNGRLLWPESSLNAILSREN